MSLVKSMNPYAEAVCSVDGLDMPNMQTTSALFRGSADCVKVLDLDGHLRMLNPGGVKLLELDFPEQLHGQLWSSLWPVPGNGEAERCVRDALQGRVSTFTGACPTAQGNMRWWEVTASPVHDADGRVENVLVVSRDVTELVRARAELEAASLRKDAILETVAHELRNPLSAALNASQLLARLNPSAAEIPRIAQIINRQLGHISRMTEDLIDSGRVARGELKLVKTRVSVDGIVRVSIEQLRAAAEKKHQQLRVALCNVDCDVEGDETRLIQAIGNLIGNAVRYTPEQGVICIDVIKLDSVVDVIVKDSGIGIDRAQLGGLFDRYARVQSDSARSNSGLGIGLSLVKAIAELHGGTIVADSAGVGAGSTFTMRLPIIQTQAALGM